MIVGLPRRQGFGDMINGRNGPVDVGPENQLSEFDGEDANTIHAWLAEALGYLTALESAVDGSPGETMWNMKISSVRSLVQRAYDLTGPGTIFLGNSAKAAYRAAGLAYTDLWRRVTLSPDTIREPPDVGGVFDALTSAGGSAIDSAKAGVEKALGIAGDTVSTVKWTAIGLGAVAVAFIFYLTYETGKTARAIGPRVLR